MKKQINEDKIVAMRKGGAILADVLYEVMSHVKPGVSEFEMDKLAEELILKKGGYPGFKKVPGYKHTICAATNEVVVHGIPSKYIYKEGDVACIDCGVFIDGYHTDMAETVFVKGSSPLSQGDKEKIEFLNTGKKALDEAIKVAKAGRHIGHISQAIQDVVEGKGYSVVRNLVGHGVGEKLHMPPEVPGFLDKPIEKTPLLTEGMTIAIEVIYNMGGPDVVYANNDGWTISSEDGSLSAVFERTVLITKTGCEVLTA